MKFKSNLIGLTMDSTLKTDLGEPRSKAQFGNSDHFSGFGCVTPAAAKLHSRYADSVP
jgi:hypothetical protein